MTKGKGRPVKYETPEEMQKIIDDYFDNDAFIESGDTKMFAPTVTGIASALGMTREGLIHYAKKDDFADTIKKAKDRVAIALEQRLYSNSVTGVIFNLKNNFGWKDKTETELSGSVHLTAEQWLDELD